MRSFGRKSIGKNLDSRCSLGDNLGVPVEGPHKPEHYRYQADSNLETRKANGEICSPFLALETDRKFSENQFVQTMEKYCRQALKRGLGLPPVTSKPAAELVTAH